MTWRKARFGLFRYNSGFDRVAPTFPRLVGQRFPFLRGERKRVSKEVRTLIFRTVAENPTWGAPRIHGELLKLGFELSEGVSRDGCGELREIQIP
jgi:hypothetical protein